MTNSSHSPKRSPRAFGLALVASLALTGLLATSAMALSISPSIEHGFISGGAVTFVAAGDTTYSCESSESSWSASGSTSSITEEKLRGCHTSIFGIRANCTTAGQTTGTIALAKLEGSLVYLDAAKTKFGLKVSPVSGSVVTEFTCGSAYSYKWTGTVLGQITNPALNVLTTAATLRFTSTGAHQDYQQIEGAGTAYHLSSSKGGGTPTELGVTADQQLNAKVAYQFLP